MPEPELISSDEVLREAGAERPVTEGTFLQKTGLQLATGIGAVATVVTVALVIKWIIYAPTIPTIPIDMDREKARVAIENYKQLQSVVLEPFTILFDSVVVKVLLPVFTSVLGYIFGSQSAGRRSKG
jgi:hypothetical protein